MKKTIITIVVAVSAAFQLAAQNGVAINTTGASADQSAMLDVSSSTKGFLTPRMSKQERTDIVNPVRGLLVYQIDDDYGFWFFDGTGWQKANAGDNLGNHTATDSIDMANNKIKNLATCTHNLDAANKEYVDNAVSAGGGASMPTMISDESATTMSFVDALRYCRNLTESGYSDWMMPTTEDVFYIMQLGGSTVIPNETSANLFWLSDTDPVTKSYAYHYYNIRLSNLYRTASTYTTLLNVRCVR